MTPALKETARKACEQLTATEQAIRVAAQSVNALGALASEIQQEAQDAEFTVTPAQRSLLDGTLLQRTAFVNATAARVAADLRTLARGIRDLRTDCEAVQQ